MLVNARFLELKSRFYSGFMASCALRIYFWFHFAYNDVTGALSQLQHKRSIGKERLVLSKVAGRAESISIAKAFALFALLLAVLALALTPGYAFAAEEEEDEDDDLVAGWIDFSGRGNGGSDSSEDAWANIKDLPLNSKDSQNASSDASAKADGTNWKDVKSGSSSSKDFVPTTTDEFGRVSYAVFPYFPNPTTETFVKSIGEDARKICQKDGLYASVMIAQAILESGSGSSGLSKPPYNNLFGIKGSYKGANVVLMTSEDDGTGHEYDISAAFRRYPSTKESLQDYADLLKRDMGTFYAPAWKANAPTYVQACNYLQGHYATDTSYSGKLQGLILAYNLTTYDHPASWAKTPEARTQIAAAKLRAYTLGGRAVTLQKLDSNELADAQAASEAVRTASEADVASPDFSADDTIKAQAAKDAAESAAFQRRFVEPLSNPAVQVSVVSFGVVTVLLAKKELITLLAALKGALSHLPFIPR